MKVCFDTFGCRLNRAEALQMEADFLARGWQTTDAHADADMIVVRGCSVTARAQRDCERHVARLREKHPNKRIVVTGCLKEKANEHWLRDVGRRGAGRPPPAVPTRTARAYLKVQDGCAFGCAFCIVPRLRGAAVSVDFTEALDKARAFLDAGYREIVVTGCNLSLYHSQGKGLADLAAALADLDPTRRIRLGSVEPSPAAREVVAAMAARPNICRYLHLPVQSGSNMVLAAMRRPYAMRNVDEILGEALRRMPDLAIGCDLMTGFPGEGELDFLATRMLFKRFPLARVHVFPFSERPGTAAAELPFALPREVRRERAQALAALADAARTRYAKRFVGRTVEIVVEDEARLAGWTGEYLWCAARQDETVRYPYKRKDLVRIRVQEAEGHALTGVPA